LVWKHDGSKETNGTNASGMRIKGLAVLVPLFI